MSAWNQVRHQLRLPFGRLLASLRLHRWNAVPDTQPEWWRKRRTRLGESLIGLGNRYLLWQGALSEVLPCAEWLAREVAVARQLDRRMRVAADGRGLEFPRFPGHSLGSLLRSSLPPEDKRHAIHLAARALRDLHQHTAHGDATSHNVIVDLEGSCASWVDFDMRHRAGIDALTCHADDVRALLWSAATALDGAQFSLLVKIVQNAYREDSVLGEVLRLMERAPCPCVFQLAQAPLSPRKRLSLFDALSGIAE